MIFRPGNIVFRVARTDKELNDTHAITNKIYRDVGYILENEPDVFPDKYSEFSTIFYAARNGRVVGGIRAVNDVIGLPMDNIFDISEVKEDIKLNGGRYVGKSCDWFTTMLQKPVIHLLSVFHSKVMPPSLYNNHLRIIPNCPKCILHFKCISNRHSTIAVAMP